MMLGGQTIGTTTPPGPMVATITRLTTLFWRATVRGDSAAAASLAAAGATPPPGDRFDHK